MSLKVDYNSLNIQKIIVTLSESMVNTLKYTPNITYTFYFTHEQTDTVYTIDLTDNSIVPFRFNEFEFTTSIDTRPPNNVPFEQVGWYKYQVYYVDPDKDPPSGYTGVFLELGKMYVDDGVPLTNVYDQTKTKYVYKA